MNELPSVAADAAPQERSIAVEASRYVAEAEAYIAEATKAITGLTVGGSEFFTRKGDAYRADLKACVQHIRERFQRDHERTVEAIRARRAAEAERDSVKEEWTKAEARIEELSGRLITAMADAWRAEQEVEEQRARIRELEGLLDECRTFFADCPSYDGEETGNLDTRIMFAREAGDAQ